MVRTISMATVLVAAVGGVAVAQETVKTAWGTFNFERELGVTRGGVAGSADAVFQSLKTILTDLGVKINDEDAAGRQLVVNKQRLVRRLGKKPLSTFLRCGEGLTGPNADSWYVYVNIGAAVTPVGASRSDLRLTISADAIDVPGGRNDRVVCATTGALEMELVKGLRVAFPGTT